MTDSIKEKAKQMASEGKTVPQISKELGVGYWEARAHVVPSSWHGAKQIITRRLNQLIKEKDQATREQLVNQAAEYINYIYYDAKELSRRIDRVRKALM